ncbi:tRNA (guanine(37)-N1)-methyltransferase [Chamberlinius hualienensis]
MLSVLYKNRLLRSQLNVKFASLIMQQTMSTRSVNNRNCLVPPATVRGMTELNREAFKTTLPVPRITVKENGLNKLLRNVKPLLLKMSKLPPVLNLEAEGKKSVLLNPNLVSDMADVNTSSAETAEILKECEAEFSWYEIELNYENWKTDDIFDAVLPDDQDKFSGYSRIGHIIHVNLKQHLKEYRYLIAQVLLDKLNGIKTVVNKVDTIDSEFRNFKMEILAGESNMVALVKENRCDYEFDFSLVFWNPRLCTEHERIVNNLKEGSVLYDLFAGVGPFSIPAAKLRKCEVFANDLNPHSFKWLQHNAQLNKVNKRQELMQTFNMDARDFVRTVIKRDLVDRWNRYLELRQTEPQTEVTWSEINIIMNLPALAVEFLDAFIGLLKDNPGMQESDEFIPPNVFCYTFVNDKGNFNEPIDKVENILKGAKLDAKTSVSFVRNVSPNKEMMRISFPIPKFVLFESGFLGDVNKCDDSPKSKRVKLK